jgi:tRNA-uridine 2-sulfurtransferase
MKNYITNMNKSDRKAFVLFSNGLDSRLVIKILKEQIRSKNIIALYFLLPFTPQNREKEKEKEELDEIKFFLKKEKVKLVIIDCTRGKFLREYINLIKNPKHGRGKGLNPCVDCKIFMLKKAKKFAKKYKINNDSKRIIPIIVTGEVLGQRPMSQIKYQLELIEKRSDLKNRILRPLSAKLLQETLYEKNNIIDREKLFSIQGRTRKRQMDLAKKYKITFPTPAGGCLLCDKCFTEKLKILLKEKNPQEIDIDLLRIGKHFENESIILGRNEKENRILESIAEKYKKGIIIIPLQPGPTALVRKKLNRLIKKAEELIRKYSKKEVSGFKIKRFY